jgi:hypothetical protein
MGVVPWWGAGGQSPQRVRERVGLCGLTPAMLRLHVHSYKSVARRE